MVLDRASLKQESKALLKTARVNPYLFTLLVLAVTLVISGISNYMNMDDEFAYLYSVQYGIDLVQRAEDVYPASMDLTLTKIEQEYEVSHG